MSSVRPILYSAPMIRALLAGRKTQTRRLASSATKRYGIKGRDHFATHTPSPHLKQINGQPDWCVEMISIERGLWHPETNSKGSSAWYAKSPWGGPGDLLWVRETFHLVHVGGVHGGGVPPSNSYELGYAAEDYLNPRVLCTFGNDDPHLQTASDSPRPSIHIPRWHMPRWASRMTLAITDVRIERLQEISEADAKAEGAEQLVMDDDGNFYQSQDGTHRCGYAGLWDHINGDGSWDANPWVVALTFTVHRQNIDTFLAQRTEAV